MRKIGDTNNKRGTIIKFHPDPEIFGNHKFKPKRLISMARSKAYLFSGVEIKWKSEIDDGETPLQATFHFPGGLSDYLNERLGVSSTYADTPFHGKVKFSEKFQSKFQPAFSFA